MRPVTLKMRWSSMLSRSGLFSLLWWILSDGAQSSWWIGVPAVLLAVVAGTLLLPPLPFLWHELLRFAPFFLLRSLLGGVDVSWRAFHPDMPIAPDLIEYRLRIPPGLPQVFMVNTVSLLPGTLSAELDRDVLKVHVLDGRKDFLAVIESVEKRVAGMFAASRTLAWRGEAYKTIQRYSLPRKEIPALAKRLGADLVIMGTVARTGIPGFLIGNTAETMLNQIDCSVLAIKPPGFVTPVTLED